MTEPSCGQFPAYNGPGFETVRGEKTGFFHVERQGEIWWLIDPDGRGFLDIGIDHLNWNLHACEPLGYSPYHRFVQQKYGREEKWADAVAERMRRWGFNTLAAGHAELLRYRGFPHIEWYGAGSFVDQEDIVPRTWWTGFPNVFSPAWPAFCDRQAREICPSKKDDPWLIGYFLDNELEWFGSIDNELGGFSECGLALAAWRKPADHTAKQALVEVAQTCFRRVGQFNDAWQTRYRSFAEFAASANPVPPASAEAKRMAREYVRLVADRYFKAATDAIRKWDPNHMILGTRFAEIAPDVWDICGKYCDIVSLNTYPNADPDRGVPSTLLEYFRRIYEQAGKPLMVTEWDFPALDSRIPHKEAVGIRLITQKQRARCARCFQRYMFSLPWLVGSHWYSWTDEPVLGMFNTMLEDGNSGLVNEKDEPWPELIEGLTEVNSRVYEIHLTGRLDMVYTPEPPVKWERSAPAIATDALPAELIVETGELQVIGDTDNQRWRLRYQHHPIGAYQPSVHQRGAAPLKPEAIDITGLGEDRRFTVVEMRLSHSTGREVGAWAAGWRLWVPRKSCGWLAAQHLWIENTGAEPWTLTGICHFRRIEGGTRGDQGIRPPTNVVRFCEPMAAWQENGFGYGQAMIGMGDGVGFHFRRDGDGFLSECSQEANAELAPGARQVGDGSVVLVFGYLGSSTPGQLVRLVTRARRVRKEAERLAGVTEGAR